jgi:prevent-host-death family protein
MLSAGLVQVDLVHMVTHLNISEAKAKLSELVNAAIAGEEVFIDRAGKPAVRLVPVETPSARALGFLPLDISDGLFDPLDPAETAEWE